MLALAPPRIRYTVTAHRKPHESASSLEFVMRRPHTFHPTTMTTPNANERPVSRRALLQGAAAACAATIAAPFINRGRYQLFAWSPAEYSARTIALMQRSTVMDMLCVLTLDFTQGGKWMASPETFTDRDFQKWR